jgi:hypothetical protein
VDRGKRPLRHRKDHHTAPGRFAVTGHVVRYAQRRTLYRELIPTGYTGSVSRTAKFNPIYWAHARCLKSMKPRLLHGQYVRNPLLTISG